MTTVIESGEILADASYTLKEFERRTGLKRDAIRTARQNGLIVRRRHNRGYIVGRDWLNYLNATDSTSAK